MTVLTNRFCVGELLLSAENHSHAFLCGNRESETGPLSSHYTEADGNSSTHGETLS